MLKIDTDKCVGCGVCVDVCPHGAISVQNSTAMIDQKLCRQCENCAVICPTRAIYAVEPVYAQSGKGGDEMRGRGWFGRGYPGWGRGNPYPFCRFYPWLPRRWWAAPYAHRYETTVPYGNFGYPYRRTGTYYPVAAVPY